MTENLIDEETYETLLLEGDWTPVPAVREGGKKHFHVRFTRGYREALVWDRNAESWIYTSDERAARGAA